MSGCFNPAKEGDDAPRHFQERMPYGLFVPDVLDATAYTLEGSDQSDLSEWPEARASARLARTS